MCPAIGVIASSAVVSMAELLLLYCNQNVCVMTMYVNYVTWSEKEWLSVYLTTVYMDEKF